MFSKKQPENRIYLGRQYRVLGQIPISYCGTLKIIYINIRIQPIIYHMVLPEILYLN
jgi:hypothetical protein